MSSSRRLERGTRRIRRSLVTSVPHEEGQTMAEYALILGLVMLAALAAFTSFAQVVVGLYDRFTAVLP
jgi:Flp pilus assembly pilin Flp